MEIVDPEVQLFDGADGGEEQQLLEGMMQASDSDFDDSEHLDHGEDSMEETKKEGLQ